MHFKHVFAFHKGCQKIKKPSLPVAGFCLLTIIGLLIICYDDNLTDNNDPPVVAFQSSVFIFHSGDAVTLIKVTKEEIILPLLNAFSFLTRAPPIV